MNITKNLELEIETELVKLSQSIPHESFSNIMQWMFDEYKNCMMIGREAFEENLDNILSGDYPDKDIFKLLKDNIEKYGAPKAFLNVARNHLNEAPQVGIKQ
jgi:hypothetical protein